MQLFAALGTRIQSAVLTFTHQGPSPIYFPSLPGIGKPLASSKRGGCEVVAVRIDRGGAVIVAAVMMIGFGPMAGHPAAGLLLGILTALSLLLHECGHVAAANALGVRVREIGFCRMGSYIRREQAREPLDDTIISLCGPMVNAVAAVALWTAPGVGHWLAIYNLALAASNLVPVPGSDGRRMVNAWRKRGTAPGTLPIALSKDG